MCVHMRLPAQSCGFQLCFNLWSRYTSTTFNVVDVHPTFGFRGNHFTFIDPPFDAWCIDCVPVCVLPFLFVNICSGVFVFLCQPTMWRKGFWACHWFSEFGENACANLCVSSGKVSFLLRVQQCVFVSVVGFILVSFSSVGVSHSRFLCGVFSL